MSFPRYLEYKDSGVEWLGQVPTHWDIRRLKFLCDIQTGDKDTENAVEDGEYPFFVRSQTVERIDSFTFDCEAVLTAGDGAGVGKVFHYYEGPFDFHQRVYMLNRFRGVSGRYIFHYLRENFYKVALEGGAKSTVDSLRRPMFTNFPVVIPPSDEQDSIVAFMERETAEIDALVAEQERLIELLKEKRQAVISHAVTQGLNPDVPMKDSGIEWLAEIPSHWRVAQVKHLARQEPKAFSDGDWIEAPYITTDGVRLIQTGNVGIGAYKEQGFRYISEATFDELGCTEVNPHDVLICRLDGPVGRACLAPDLGCRMITSVDNAILKVASDVHPEFVVFLFSSVPWISWIDALCRVGGGFRLRISRSQLGELRVPLPPYEEQVAIANHLAAQAASSEPLIAQAKRAIDLLQERRTALISAAVTGQIDVRSAAERPAA